MLLLLLPLLLLSLLPLLLLSRLASPSTLSGVVGVCLTKM
jgi:hypothetical protein